MKNKTKTEYITKTRKKFLSEEEMEQLINIRSYKRTTLTANWEPMEDIR